MAGAIHEIFPFTRTLVYYSSRHVRVHAGDVSLGPLPCRCYKYSSILPRIDLIVGGDTNTDIDWTSTPN